MGSIYPICQRCKFGTEGNIPEGAEVGVPFRCSVNGTVEQNKCKKFKLKLK